MSSSETEATELSKKISVPKLLIIAAVMGGVLGVLNALIPESVSWNQRVINMSFWSWFLKMIIGAAVVGAIVYRFKKGKLEWLRKSESESI